jgi:hypothetical protein
VGKVMAKSLISKEDVVSIATSLKIVLDDQAINTIFENCKNQEFNMLDPWYIVIEDEIYNHLRK